MNTWILLSNTLLLTALLAVVASAVPVDPPPVRTPRIAVGINYCMTHECGR